MASPSSSALFMVFCLCFEYGIGKYTKDTGIHWPNKYHIRYEELDVVNGAVTDVSMWYAAKYNMARKDFNGGSVKKFYENTTEYSLLPAMNADDTFTIKCLEKASSDTVDLLSPIFDENFELSDKIVRNPLCVSPTWHLASFFNKSNRIIIGKETFDGKEVRVWKKKWPYLEETLYVYQSNGYDIPFRLITKQFDENTAKKIKHTITNFYYYSGRVTKRDISIEELYDKTDCKGPDQNEEHPQTSLDLDSIFEIYKKRHNKNYASAKEHKKRQEIFHKNLRKVMEHNSKNLSYRMGLNQFSDMTSEEKKFLKCVRPSHPADRGTHFLSNKVEELRKLASEYPEEMDLRIKGVVTPVKNQLRCGSCWSFATAAAVEGSVALKNGGRLLDLSEQCLIDCAWGYKCDGCDGGELSGSFRFVYMNGLPTEADYGTYVSQEEYCHRENASELFGIKGFGRITPRSDLALKAALNNYGPVAVAIYASDNIYMYQNGVFHDTECDSASPESINHAVTVVGYGVRDGDTYWIVKNSWGNIWGQDGYILMSANDNNCFVEDEGYFAVY